MFVLMDGFLAPSKVKVEPSNEGLLVSCAEDAGGVAEMSDLISVGEIESEVVVDADDVVRAESCPWNRA